MEKLLYNVFILKEKEIVFNFKEKHIIKKIDVESGVIVKVVIGVD